MFSVTIIESIKFSSSFLHFDGCRINFIAYAEQKKKAAVLLRYLSAFTFANLNYVQSFEWFISSSWFRI